MATTYDSLEIYVAEVFETNNRESSEIVYAGPGYIDALDAIKATRPGEYDFARIQEWKEGTRRGIKEFCINQRVEVEEV